MFMSNAAAAVALLFDVIRRCPAGECESGCNCHVVTVEVDVDELTAVEVAHFQAHGTAAQRAEILAYLAPCRSPSPRRRVASLSRSAPRRRPGAASARPVVRPGGPSS